MYKDSSGPILAIFFGSSVIEEPKKHRRKGGRTRDGGREAKTLIG